MRWLNYKVCQDLILASVTKFLKWFFDPITELFITIWRKLLYYFSIPVLNNLEVIRRDKSLRECVLTCWLGSPPGVATETMRGRSEEAGWRRRGWCQRLEEIKVRHLSIVSVMLSATAYWHKLGRLNFSFPYVCSHFNAVFGVHDTEPHYKWGALYSMCFSICRQWEPALNEHVASQRQQGATIGFVFLHYESHPKR